MFEKVQNAIIESAEISNDDHGVLSAWVGLEMDGTGVGFGGFCLFNPNYKYEDCTGRFIWRVLEVAGVNHWSKLVGKTVRAEFDGQGGPGSRCVAIGHIIKDIWFRPGDELKREERLAVKA